MQGNIAMIAARIALLLSLLALGGFCRAQQCSDGIDNNSNGLTDLTDWYCKAAADNDEGSFHSGVPGDDANSAASLDCWFDTNSGNGDDGCSMHACCDIDGACPSDLLPAQFNASQCTPSETCRGNCIPQTKPGCDCFGCCEICTTQNGCLNVFVNPVVSPACTIETLGDPSSCRRCVQDAACLVPYVVFADGFEVPQGMPGSLAAAIEHAMR